MVLRPHQWHCRHATGPVPRTASRPRRSFFPSFLVLSSLFVLAGCNDLRDYDGSWSGTVVGDDTPDFILSGFPEGTQLQIRDFAPQPSDSPPGFVSTPGYDAFDDTPLEVITPLENDLLSSYDFPGMGRVRNYIYATRPTAGPLAGRDAMVFVSLIDDDALEVRVIVGSGEAATGGHFGLWHLDRQ